MAASNSPPDVQSRVLSTNTLAATRFNSLLFTKTVGVTFLGAPGEMRTDMIPIDSTGLRLARVRSTGHVIDICEDQSVTMLLPRRGRLAIEASRKTWQAEAGELLAFRPNSRRTRAIAEDGLFEATILMIPRARLETLAGTAGLPDPFSGGPDGRHFAAPVAAPLRGLLSALSDQLLRDDGHAPGQAALPTVGVLLEELLLDLRTSSETRCPRDAIRKVRAAEEIMRARGDEILSMADLARELGIGLRSLQLAFSEVRGMSPRSVLSRIRLERARSRLLAAEEGTQVTMVALDCGFAHLSRFAEAYRRTFGERPSETLARRR